MLNMTEEHLKLLDKYPKYSQDGKGENAEVVFKVHNPYGRGAWYILEAEKMYDGKDYLLFGFVESPIVPEFNEYGYFLLSELCKLEIPCYAIEDNDGKKIFLGYGNLEIDKTFKNGTTMGEVFEQIKNH